MQKKWWNISKEKIISWWTKQSKDKSETTTAGSKKKKSLFSWIKKYIPSVMLFWGSLGANATPMANTPLNNDASGNKKEWRQKQSKPVSSFKYRGKIFDMSKMSPEMESVLYMTGGKSDILYTSNGKKATLQNATGIGPLLTGIDDFVSFINAHAEEYPDLKRALDTAGVRSEAMMEALRHYNMYDELQRLSHSLTMHFWDRDIQPTMDKLAKAGVADINKSNYSTAKNSRIAAGVISGLGQSKRKTADIYIEAKQRRGNNASEAEIAEEAFKIRFNLWGLKERVYGKNGSIGEMEMNRLFGDYKEAQDTSSYILPTKSLSQDTSLPEEKTEQAQISERVVEIKKETGDDNVRKGENFVVQGNSYTRQLLDDMQTLSRDATDFVQEEPGYWINQNMHKNGILSVQAKKALEIKKLEMRQQSLNKTINDLQEQLAEKSNYKLSILGNKISCNFKNMNPVNVLIFFESANDPGMRDPQNLATGPFQMNHANTLPAFVRSVAKEYPELYNVMDRHGVYSDEFHSIWKKIAYSAEGEHFKELQFDYMWDNAYKRNFTLLHEKLNMPVVTKDMLKNIDKYPEICVYAAEVMSMTNQNPCLTPRKIEQSYNRLKKASATIQITPNMLGLASLDEREAAHWGSRSRYNGPNSERAVCEAMYEYAEIKQQINAKKKELENTNMALAQAQMEQILPPHKSQNMLAHNLFNSDDMSLKDKMDAIASIMKNKRNFRERRKAQGLVRKKYAQLFSGEEVKVPSGKNKYKQKGKGRSPHTA